ncbi:O-antigen polymerase [Photobacterium phosphoreum]|uniref:O-antigen polymerase n=1 Tax=Photobacterium phosphoreum TaxID=659 RepID=UPI001E63DCED|nr:O-antigen polymerase [Photobacterium phosphoreum]MCD9475607.1 hypothetical protein [Photobacterium phosphoreum]MCF2177611.1 hypothetical protein [Photobacterium phosphoreum]
MGFFILLFLTVILLLPAFFIIKRMSGGINLNYISIWFLIYIIFSLMGALLISSGFVSSSYFVKPFNDKANVLFVGGIFTIYIGVVIFYTLSYLMKLFCFGYDDLNFKRKLIIRKDDMFALNILFFIFILSFVYFIYISFPSPLIMAFRGDNALDIANRRLDITKDLGLIGNTYIVAIGRVLSYIIPYAYIIVSRHKHNMKYKVLAIFSLLLAVFYLLNTGEKAPIVFFAMGAVLSYKLSLQKVFNLSPKIILIFSLVIVFIYFIFVSTDFEKVFLLISDRIFIAQQIAIYCSFDHYNNIFGEIGFSSMSNIFTKIFSVVNTLASSSELMKVYYPGMLENGGWNINGIFVYEAWSNFGILGVILSPFLVAIESFVFLYVIFKLPNKPFYLALYCYACINVNYFLTSFSAYFYQSDWIVFSVIIFIYLFMSSLYRAIVKEQSEQ